MPHVAHQLYVPRTKIIIYRHVWSVPEPLELKGTQGHHTWLVISTSKLKLNKVGGGDGTRLIYIGRVLTARIAIDPRLYPVRLASWRFWVHSNHKICGNCNPVPTTVSISLSPVSHFRPVEFKFPDISMLIPRAAVAFYPDL
jgi:hypothetical protein